MKPHNYTLRLLSLVCLLAVTCVAAPTKIWNQGDPSAEEQYDLEELNLYNKDPVAHATRFFALYNADPVVTGWVNMKQNFRQEEFGRDWIEKTRARVADELVRSAQDPSAYARSQAPLAFYPAFMEQAALWSAATTFPEFTAEQYYPLPTWIYPIPGVIPPGFKGSGGGQTFSGSNATGGIAKFGPYGGSYHQCSSGNYYAPYIGPREKYINLQGYLRKQGDSLPNFTLGHTRMVGINIRKGDHGNRIVTNFNGSSEFFTQSDLPFGGADTAFITGVVYKDKNLNGFYDIGEGLGGATIMPDKGDWYAVSSASGGFAIPVKTNSGTYKLAITTGELAGKTSEVTVAGESVKSDWVLPGDPVVLPAQTKVAQSSGTTQLTGLSTRGLIEQGSNALVGGFVIAGGDGAKKRVLIRGVGPSLETLGFSRLDIASSTTLDVYDGKGVLIATNTQWWKTSDNGKAVAAAAVSVGDFPLTALSGDSALVLDLPAGGYTAVVRPSNPAFVTTNKIGLLEVYDLTPNIGGRFVNVATRGRVDTGLRQMIVGCTIKGDGSKRVLLRGVGSELGSSFGLTGVLPNPEITLYAGDGAVLANNDNWSHSEQTDQIRELATASGAFGLTEGNPDAAIIRLLKAGNYTAAVGGKVYSLNNGVAIVELYEAP